MTQVLLKTFSKSILKFTKNLKWLHKSWLDHVVTLESLLVGSNDLHFIIRIQIISK